MELPLEEELLSFIKELGYSGKCDMLSAIHTDQMHQPWRIFASIINRYGEMIPDGMINEDIKLSKAYKTYLDYATGKKSKRVKRPTKKSTIAPTTGVVIRDTPGVSISKKKAPAKVDRGKGITLLLDATLLKDAQLKKALKKSMQETRKLQASGSSEGAYFESEGNSEDESNDVNDEDDNDDESRNDDDGEEYVHTPDYNVPTDEETDDENMEFDDEEYDDLYKDVNVRLKVTKHKEVGKGDVKKTKGSKQSSSVSSDFTSEFLNLDNVLPVVDEVASMMNVKSYTAEFEKKVQKERKLYIDVIEKSVKDIIKDEVKSQLPLILPKEVSDFATPVI
uniref:Uncharacterized protein n=1 Tax=Tanacetum cinerariifolium TaxID=118510 RepID=A0A699IET4_TANCI|nr:hypothetical protein [Tanacetum cinerariifolium]